MTESSAAGVPTCYRHPDREAHIRCQRCERPICPDCMTAASVGFQCPECVKEGRSTQRPVRTTYGGLRPSAPGFVTMVLIGINAVVWLLVMVTGRNSSRLLSYLELRPSGLCEIGPAGFDVSRETCTAHAGTYHPGVSDGAYWQLITSTFTHVEVLHIGFNMLALWVLGPQVEQLFGRARFLALYLLSGLAGSALVYATAPLYTPTVGASGAIFGLMGALLVVAVRTRTNASSILVWIAINAVLTLSVPNISWQGHLGGFIGGVLVSAVIVWAPRKRRRQIQWGGMGLVAVAIAVTIALRTAALV
ncbi:rhomboid family intramembrane serine protease [Nocardioides sp. CER19]|uniref:rhomboid family intramembrane serine protease n=1 Tax=Nocardioides sp. CER19 TaxID=3038538 RepID=UPI002448CE66|nr:rhomboid family intramembrane serine protease [Nocardioides sp. CER19]MDH2412781.1 rhomboid family intramembrane serine protease [Nocardioides sp. CER19]